MDIEFLVRDTFALVRPHWQLATGVEEASQKFAEAVAQNYKGQEAERAAEPEEMPLESSSDDELDEDENRLPELEEVHSSSDDNEVCIPVVFLIRQCQLTGLFRHRCLRRGRLLN
jgi:regulator of nonsense transcripts 2